MSVRSYLFLWSFLATPIAYGSNRSRCIIVKCQYQRNALTSFGFYLEARKDRSLTGKTTGRRQAVEGGAERTESIIEIEKLY